MKPGFKRLPYLEFVSLMAFLFATVALAIDTMLPALPRIAQDLTPLDPNRAQLIVTSFVLGMGVGTLFTGPVADAIGRRPVILWGMALYMLGAALAIFEPNLELLLAARFVQGLGAAGPRVAAMAIVRDLYAGRMMARLMSLILIVFMLVPAVAPALGALVLKFSGWREIFVVFIVFGAVAGGWFALRHGETLDPKDKRPFRLVTLRAGIAEIGGHPLVLIYIGVLAIVFSILFGMISSIQPIMDVHFGKAAAFPYWFALIAVIAGSAGFLNASLVLKLGMQLLVTVTFVGQAVICGVAALCFWLLPMSLDQQFVVFMIWAVAIFFQTGLTVGNLNALAMEPLGHMAGLAASVISAVATIIGGGLAIPLGLAFDGTPLPLAAGFFCLALMGVILMAMAGAVQRANARKVAVVGS